MADKKFKEELMKKFLKFGAVLTAVVLGLACFAACSSEDEGGASVVAEYQAVDNSPYLYIFYDDGTYEYKEYQQLVEKGNYSGIPTKRGTVTMQRQYSLDEVSGKLIPDAGNYYIVIYKDGDDLCFEDDYDNSYFLN